MDMIIGVIIFAFGVFVGGGLVLAGVKNGENK